MIGCTATFFYSALLLAAIAGSPQRAKHLTVVTGASATSNGGLTLTLDIALDESIHVYAPGAEGYLPVTWELAGSPAWKAGAVRLPPSKRLKLEAIGETVPVFEGQFQISREINALKRGELTIEGTLRYQACDDRLCYRPETVPLKWIVPASLRKPPGPSPGTGLAPR